MLNDCVLSLILNVFAMLRCCLQPKTIKAFVDFPLDQLKLCKDDRKRTEEFMATAAVMRSWIRTFDGGQTVRGIKKAMEKSQRVKEQFETKRMMSVLLYSTEELSADEKALVKTRYCFCDNHCKSGLIVTISIACLAVGT